MSWITQISDDFIIRTGDGVDYKPLWVNASVSKDYNVSEFEFVNLAGTLVDRRLPKGNRYTLEIIFQGNDHLDVAANFSKSADNPKFWSVKHPFYGLIYVQPLSINQSNAELNTSKFTIPVVETITEDVPKTHISDFDSINTKKANIDETAEGLVTLSLYAINRDYTIKQNKKRFDLSVPIIKIPKQFETYLNVFNQANSLIDTATASPLLAMRALVSLITAPSKFTASVSGRMATLKDQFGILSDTVSGITQLQNKQLYQLQAGTVISSMCNVVTTPITNDFSNNKKVSAVSATINSTYTKFLADLDLLQSINGGSVGSFIPDFNFLFQLNDLINSTNAYLLQAVIGARREHSIICEEDTNIIILTHRFYGLDENDNNINELIDNNNLSLDELVLIKKGRKIIYYV